MLAATDISGDITDRDGNRDDNREDIISIVRTLQSVLTTAKLLIYHDSTNNRSHAFITQESGHIMFITSVTDGEIHISRYERLNFYPFLVIVASAGGE
jgi:hypothetical protein